ncbi:hypothetical protein B0H15DRAFT_831759 [Mycena belliarum]|uniref:Protein kinase domain-containing protein n=1 Tax=Mycena belliarum TaxID=1033014 RepID=A0AAD6XTC8_9AGAR|nr:hypothetical protein B0H15DRAFT_831759 [Mycena belliae]
MPHGSIQNYLATHARPAFPTRARWVLDIARGAGHLHAAGVLWNDCSIFNALLADDGAHARICDFGKAVIWPAVACPRVGVAPPPYAVPLGHAHTSGNAWAPDLFALAGVAMFLLAWRHPCAAVAGLNGWTSEGEYMERCEAHERGEFDALDPARFGEHLARVVARGFRLEHADAREFASEFEDALARWEEAFGRGELPDPDTLIPEIAVADAAGPAVCATDS